MGIQESERLKGAAWRDMSSALTHGQRGASDLEGLAAALSVQERLKVRAEGKAVEVRGQLFEALTGLRRLAQIFEDGAQDTNNRLLPQAGSTLAAFHAAKTDTISGIENLSKAQGTDTTSETLAAIPENIDATISAVQKVEDNGKQAVVEFGASHTSANEMAAQLDSLMTAFDGLTRTIPTIGTGPDKDVSANAAYLANATESSTDALTSLSQVEESLSRDPLFIELRYRNVPKPPA